MNPISQSWEALQDRLRQTVETKKSRGRFGIISSDVDLVDPGENLAEYWEEAIETAIVRLSLLNFAYDVAEPGIRVDGDDQAVKYLKDEWLPQAGIIAGERHKPFDPLVPLAPMQRWGRGGFMLEHVRADPDDPDSQITGVNPIRPETGVFQTLANKQILVEPDDVDNGALEVGDVRETRRGEPAAFIQWHSDALRGSTSRNAVPLSTNDFSRTVFSPGIGGGPMSGVWGRPVTATIADDLAGFKNIRRALEQAIMGKGWGLWDLEFKRDVLEYTEDGQEVTEIIGWSEGDKTDYENQVKNLEPGGVITHDGIADVDRVDPTVPDLIDDLEFYVSNITAALPTPKFVIGFEENINQFVTEGQDARYQLLVNYERDDIAAFLTELFTAVLEQNQDMSDPELEVKLEPPDHESPILSLEKEQIEKIGIWITALKEASGTSDPNMLVDEELIRELILQLPENSGPNVDENQVSSDDPEIQDQIAELKQLIDDGDAPADPGDVAPGEAPADD